MNGNCLTACKARAIGIVRLFGTLGTVWLVLVGCAGTRAPIPDGAVVTPPAEWRTSTGRGPSPRSRWWETFDDPALTRIVDAALARNIDVQIAVARIEEVTAQAQLAQAQRMPNVSGEVAHLRERDVNPGFGIPEVQTATQGVLTISYDVDLFGRLSSASAAARASLLATRAAADGVRLATAAIAARDYLALRALDARQDILQQTLNARARTLRLVRRRASVGYGSQLDIAQAEADFHATEQLIPATAAAGARYDERQMRILDSEK